MFKITERINNLLFKFLWDNKGDKIKRTEIMIADYQLNYYLKVLAIRLNGGVGSGHLTGSQETRVRFMLMHFGTFFLI